MKRKHLILVLTLSILLPTAFYQANAQGFFEKIFGKGLRGAPGEVIVSEKGSGSRTITGGYILHENKLQEVQTERKSITINKGKESEQTFELVKFIKDGKVLSIRPGAEGGPLDLTIGKNKVVFTDNSMGSLWVANVDDLEPINIQPDTVGSISQTKLYERKAELAKQGKDTDTLILYWAGNPKLSPSEDKIAFTSNREGYPDNPRSALWVTDISGSATKKIIEEDIIPVTWFNDEEFIFIGSKGDLRKVNTASSQQQVLIADWVMVTGYSPSGQYIMFQYVKDSIVQPEQYLFNLKENKSVKLDVPAGYKNNAFYGWDETTDKVAFLVQDFSANTKLIILDCNTLNLQTLDAPDGLKFDDGVVPSWSAGKVVFSAGGQLYTTK
ncbi:hypothetical protein BR63_00180 [Thermanaerosceptrum fracticalcis]|jgi:hypothetical protein|uniref:WD40 repeat domain-containing protein n=1 Tax=Thermanaerosceptrum fracticalcis TaxID=1712410 RepID=A0A7G6DYH9_THEFR|nr:PD40 domain-containing protein [Thermanaerosceptrum fracticalcis]QNB44883.1 hypothetical protein BR63_00180 [Thermanaerosceptrum fracticalcis]